MYYNNYPSSRYGVRNAQNQLGFLDIVAGIVGIVGTGASAGVQIYGTVKTLELAEEQQELEAELARKRFELEEELVAAQSRIVDIQASGIAERQVIELEIAQMQADALREQLEMVKREQELQAQIAEERARQELERLQWAGEVESSAREIIEQEQAVAAAAVEQRAAAETIATGVEERTRQIEEAVVTGAQEATDLAIQRLEPGAITPPLEEKPWLLPAAAAVVVGGLVLLRGRK